MRTGEVWAVAGSAKSDPVVMARGRKVVRTARTNLRAYKLDGCLSPRDCRDRVRAPHRHPADAARTNDGSNGSYEPPFVRARRMAEPARRAIDFAARQARHSADAARTNDG